MSFVGNEELRLRPIVELALPISSIHALKGITPTYIGGSYEGSTGAFLLFNMIPANEMVALFQACGSSKATLLVQHGNPERDDKNSITRFLRAADLPLSIRETPEIREWNIYKLGASATTTRATAAKPTQSPDSGRMLMQSERRADIIIDMTKMEMHNLHCGADVETISSNSKTIPPTETYGTGHAREQQMVAGTATEPGKLQYH